MAETEAKKEEKSIEDTFGELDLLARKLEDKVEKKMLQMNEDGTFREF